MTLASKVTITAYSTGDEYDEYYGDGPSIPLHHINQIAVRT